jgi:hypothetical protein
MVNGKRREGRKFKGRIAFWTLRPTKKLGTISSQNVIKCLPSSQGGTLIFFFSVRGYASRKRKGTAAYAIISTHNPSANILGILKYSKI